MSPSRNRFTILRSIFSSIENYLEECTLPQALCVNRALSSVDASRNRVADAGAKRIADALLVPTR